MQMIQTRVVMSVFLIVAGSAGFAQADGLRTVAHGVSGAPVGFSALIAVTQLNNQMDRVFHQAMTPAIRNRFALGNADPVFDKFMNARATAAQQLSAAAKLTPGYRSAQVQFAGSVVGMTGLGILLDAAWQKALTGKVRWGESIGTGVGAAALSVGVMMLFGQSNPNIVVLAGIVGGTFGGWMARNYFGSAPSGAAPSVASVAGSAHTGRTPRPTASREDPTDDLRNTAVQ
jgi:hypothetical protein